MIAFGAAFKSAEYPFHRCVVLSDPATNGGHLVLVRVTTDDGTWPDRECLLGPADWQELDRTSTVAYSTCKWGPAVKPFEAAVQRGLFVQIASPPSAALRRMGLLQEADESQLWLELLRDDCAIQDARIAVLLRQTDELMAIFTAMVSKLRKSGI